MLRRALGQTLPWNPPATQPVGHWNWVAPTGDRFKSGFGGQGLFVSPERDIVITFTGAPDADGVANSLGLFVQDWADELSRDRG